MYHTTRGIFLKQTPYSETSAVVKIYTEEFGLQAYMVKGLRSKRSRVRVAFMQPLALLDMVVTHNDKSKLQHIKEVKPLLIYKTITEDIRKTSVLLFINELLYKTLQEESPNSEMFSFIQQSITSFDDMDQFSNNFHLDFSLQLTRFLGFFPEGRYSETRSVFDLEGGSFIPAPDISGFGFISGEDCKNFDLLISRIADPGIALRLSVSQRRILLEHILLYYSHHIPSATHFRSHKVLQEVLK